MRRFGFLIFLLVLSIIESATSVHLTLIAGLVLVRFVALKLLIWWLFISGIVLGLLSGNFLGVNSLILVGLILAFNLAKDLLWPTLTYEVFPNQTITITVLEVIAASRFYSFFENLINAGFVSLHFDLRVIPIEILFTLVFFPLISYLSLHLTPRKQLEIRF